MTVTTRPVIRFLGVGGFLLLLAAGLPTALARGGSRGSAPRSGGGSHAGAPAHRGAPAPRASAPSGGRPTSRAVAPVRGTATGAAYGVRRTANGVARYGYGYGYGAGYGYGYGYPYYPCWGAGYGWWGAGWYGGWGWGIGWGWGWPYGYADYGPWYAPYPDTYVANVEAPAPSGPAIVETGVTPPKADVVVDGETVGFASDYNGRWDKLSLAPGSHTIAFQEKGYRTLVVTLDARPGATYVLNDALVPGDGEDHRAIAVATAEVPPQDPSPKPSPIAVGRLRVHVEPADAAVYLDGDYLGLGVELGRIHGALAVAAGTHRLEAVRPGYVSVSRVIEVGDTDVLIVDLILESQH